MASESTADNIDHDQKPADRLNARLQGLRHAAPTYATQEFRMYQVKMRLSPATMDLVADPALAPFRRLLEKACLGRKAASAQKAKLQCTKDVCDVLDMIMSATRSSSSSNLAREPRQRHDTSKPTSRSRRKHNPKIKVEPSKPDAHGLLFHPPASDDGDSAVDEHLDCPEPANRAPRAVTAKKRKRSLQAAPPPRRRRKTTATHSALPFNPPDSDGDSALFVSEADVSPSSDPDEDVDMESPRRKRSRR